MKTVIAALLLAAALPGRAAPTDSPDIKAMYDADQAARTPAGGKTIDWNTLIIEDAQRLARIKEIIAADGLHTAADFGRAAILFQHGETPRDYLMAHDLAVISLIKGGEPSRWLAAASMDRYLRSIGFPQRFGTQSRSTNGQAARLEPVDPDVPDSLRQALAVPPLAHALDPDRKPDPAPAAPSPESVRAFRQLVDEMEADLKASQAPPVDWMALGTRTERRRERVRDLALKGQLATAADYYHAALILKDALEPADLLTAHDLAIIAAGKGESRAHPVIAETLDAFLKRTDHPQRYATQFDVTNLAPPRLYPVDPSVPDSLRRAYGVPSLAEAREREAAMARATIQRVAPTPPSSPTSASGAPAPSPPPSPAG